jgi:hypothetical protein
MSDFNERVREIFLKFYSKGMTFKYPLRHLKEQLEKAILEEALQHCGGNKTEMVKLLRLKRTGTISMLQRQGLLPSRKFYMKTCSKCNEKYVSCVNWKSPSPMCTKCRDNQSTKEAARVKRNKRPALRDKPTKTCADSKDIVQGEQVLLP